MAMLQLIKRDITQAELAFIHEGYDQHTRDKGVLVQEADRFTQVVQDGNQFAGCASGLAYKDGDEFNGWFYLTDLFVDKYYRRKGLGKRLLSAIEADLIAVGVKQAWLWTAGYEAPIFYQMMGYSIFAEMENWYSDGSPRVGFRKQLQ